MDLVNVEPPRDGGNLFLRFWSLISDGVSHRKSKWFAGLCALFALWPFALELFDARDQHRDVGTIGKRITC